MYNSNDLSYDAGNITVCESCGNPTMMAYAETAVSKKTGLAYPIFGWMFSIVALLFVPILFGTLAFSMGLLTYYGRGKAHGSALMIFSFISLILGSMLSFFVSGTIFF